MKLMYTFLIAVISVVLGKKYLCTSNETVYLEKNEIVFFESYRFPFYFSDKFECKLNFSIAESNSTTQKLLIVYNLIYYNYGEFAPDFKFLILNDSFSLIQQKYNHNCNDTRVTAVQGFAVNEDINEGCPMESLSSSSPFELSDETEIIYRYDENLIRDRPCKWRFISTIQYGFKLVFQALNTSPNTTLSVKNSTDFFIVKDLIELNHAYYNEDNYLEISLSHSNESFYPSSIEFQAYVSVIKKKYETADAGCNISSKSSGPSGNFTIWKNNLFHGYKSNARCSHGEIILPNSALLIIAKIYAMETNIDYLKYDIDGQNATKIFESRNFVIETSENDSLKYVWFEFISDGSLQFLGFQISFQQLCKYCDVKLKKEIVVNFLVCKCVDPIVKCGMLFGILENIVYYCGALRCTFTFEPCDTNFLSITVESDPRDTFIFKSNNQTILEINKDNYLLRQFVLVFNSDFINTLEVTTYPSELQRKFSINFTSNEGNLPPIQPKITLSESSLNYIIYAAQEGGGIYPIEMSQTAINKNFYFKLHLNTKFFGGTPVVQLFSSDNLTSYLPSKNCFTADNPLGCNVYVKHFAAMFFYADVIPYSPVFLAIRLSNTSSKRIKKICSTLDNTFNEENPSVVGIADSEDECEIRVLVEKGMNCHISHLFTTATTNNVDVFVGSDTKFLLFGFNSKTTKEWKNIGLYSSIYTVIVPENATFFMTVTCSNNANEPFVIKEYPYKSILATNFFGTLQVTPPGDTSSCNVIAVGSNPFQIGDRPVKFTVIYSVLTFFDQIYLFKDGQGSSTIDVTLGNSMVFRNTNFSIVYVRPQTVDGFNGVIFYIESLDDNDVIHTEMVFGH